MSDIAIRVDHLSKLYRLGTVHQRPDTLRDALTGILPRIARIKRIEAEDNSQDSRNSRQAPPSPDDLWALKDVSFEVKRGEVVGIIGRNGAGKSTLLKILSRITEPSSGRAEIHGRVGSLLEVGTGFHPELTGRENIYLNGSILGMHRHEIERRFDEIVAFAEIERFLDTPVKRYSSGMYVRLAFAVAAHLEPEILLVDEVLAVGDAAFQKKCLGKMGDVARHGRTVLFVSHSMSAIQQLCNRAILVKSGRLQLAGSTNEVTSLYLEDDVLASLCWERTSDPSGDVFITRIQLCDHAGHSIPLVTTATDVAIVVDFTILRPITDLQMTVGVTGPYGEDIFDSSPQDATLDVPTQEGNYRATVHIPTDILLPTSYGVKVGFWQLQGGILDRHRGLRFRVQEAASFATLRPGHRAGVVALPCQWTVERCP